MSETIPEKTACSMLMYAGSSEMVSLMLGVMQPGVDHDEIVWYDTTIALQGDNAPWVPHDSIASYCYTALSKVGFAAKTAEDGPARITVLGEEIGKPLVGKLLQLSSEVEPRQAAFIGASGHGGTKLAIENRLSLLNGLVEKGGKPIDGSTCKKLLGVKGTPSDILESLKTANIISHESTGSSPILKYLPGPRFPELKLQDRNTLYRNAAFIALRQTFSENPDRPLTNRDIISIIQEVAIPCEELSEKEFTDRINGVTADLWRRHILTRVEGETGEAGGIKVWLTPAQLALASGLIGIFKGLLRPTPAYLKAGRAALDEILDPGNREVVRRLIGKSASLRAQNYQSRRDALQETVKYFLERNDRATLAKVLEGLREAEPTMAKKAVRIALQSLVNKGEVTAERGPSRAYFYSVMSSEKPGQGKQGMANVPRQEPEQPLPDPSDANAPRPATQEEKLALAERWGSGERYTRLTRYVRRQISNPHDADDLLSEILLHAMKSDFTIPFDNESGWIFTIASRRIKTYYRKLYRAKNHHHKIKAFHEQEAITPDMAEGIGDNIARQPLQELLATAYGQFQLQLTPRQASVLELELANPEITTLEGAAKLGIGDTAYRVARHRTRRLIRTFLKQRLQEADAEGMYIPPEFLKHLDE